MKDPLKLTKELDVCRQILDNILSQVQAADDPNDELVLRMGPICRITAQIQKLVYALVKVEKMRNQQLSKTDVLALASKIGDIAHKYMPEKKVTAFLEEVASLIDSHEAT